MPWGNDPIVGGAIGAPRRKPESAAPVAPAASRPASWGDTLSAAPGLAYQGGKKAFGAIIDALMENPIGGETFAEAELQRAAQTDANKTAGEVAAVEGVARRAAFRMKGVPLDPGATAATDFARTYAESRLPGRATFNEADDAIAATNRKLNLADSPGKQFALDAAVALGQMAPGVVGSMLTRSPVPALGSIAALSGGQKYGESRSEGRMPNQALGDAAVFAAAEAVPEVLPLGVLLKPGMKAGKRIAGAALTEGGTEALTQLSQDAYDGGVLNKPTTAEGMLGNAAYAAALGGVVGGGLGAVTAPFNRGPAPAPAAPPPMVDSAGVDGAAGPQSLQDIIDTLNRQGTTPLAFSSPAAATAAAARVQEAQARPNNAGFDVEQARRVQEDIDAGTTDPSFAPQRPERVVPGDVPIVAAPEGAVRGDDFGALAALERQRIADDYVLSRAEDRAATDPVLAAILGDPNLNQRMKVRAAYNRLSQIPEFAANDPGVGTIIAEAEGNTLASDNGAMLGLERQRAAEAYVLGEASRRSADDPVLAAIVADPNMSQPMKVREAFKRLMKLPEVAATRPGLRVNAPEDADIMGFYNGRSTPPPRMPDDPNSQPVRQGPSTFEQTRQQPSPTQADLAAGRVFFDTRTGMFTADGRGRDQWEARAQTGGSDRAFPTSPDDPEGQPGFWEERARQMGEEAKAQAQAEMEAKWEARAKAEKERVRRERERAEQAKARGEEFTGNPDADPETYYRGKYSQVPVKAKSGFWNVNDRGYVAGEDGTPVAFRRATEAAKWAAKNAMAGDFAISIWGANSERITLRRNANSTYGTRPKPEGPQDPPAGRSSDTSQRGLPGPPPAAPPPQTPPTPPPSAPQGQGGGVPPVTPTPPPPPPPKAPKPKVLKPSTKPVDMATLLAKNGGLNDAGIELIPGQSRGHALIRSLGQKFIPGAGNLIRKNGGMTIQQATEFLHQLGWFPGRDLADISEAEMIEAIRDAMNSKVYHPGDAAPVEDYGDEATQQAILNVAGDLGITIPEADLSELADRIGPEGDIEQGIADYVNEQFAEVMAEARDFSDYDAGQEEFPDGPITGTEDRADGTGSEGLPPPPVNQGQGQPNGQEPAGNDGADQGAGNGSQPQITPAAAAGLTRDEVGALAYQAAKAWATKKDSAIGAFTSGYQAYMDGAADNSANFYSASAAQGSGYMAGWRAAETRFPPFKERTEGQRRFKDADEAEAFDMGIAGEDPPGKWIDLPLGVRQAYSEGADVAKARAKMDAKIAAKAQTTPPPGATNLFGDPTPAATDPNAPVDGSLGLFTDQPTRDGMTERQKAELAARQQQSTNTRLGQEAIDQQEGGMFDAAQNQADAFGGNTGRQETEQETVHDKLDGADKATLAAHYGRPSYDSTAKSRFVQDVINATNNGIETIAAAIRSIVRKVQAATLSVAIIFSPNALMPAPATVQQTYSVSTVIDIKQAVPANARDQMSPLAQGVYEAMAPTAKGKGFLIADKPNGVMHAFDSSGGYISSTPALFGRGAGDVIDPAAYRNAKFEGAPSNLRITPSGQYRVRMVTDAEYAGGKRLALESTVTGLEIVAPYKDITGVVSVHSVYLGNPSENRAGRMSSATAADNKISYGCVNTSEQFFIKDVIGRGAEFDGGMIFVMPDATENTAKEFPARQRTETTTSRAPSQAPIEQGNDIADAIIGTEGRRSQEANRRGRANSRGRRNELAEGMRAAAATLRAELDRLGLGDVDVDTFLSSLARPYLGSFESSNAGMFIKVAMQAPGKMLESLHHEAMHAMREMGLFSDDEWLTLSDKAASTPMLQWARRNYPGLNPEAQMEEAVVEMFARREGGGPVRRAALKVMKLLRAVRRAFRTNGLQTADDIMDAIASGKIGNRGREQSASDFETVSSLAELQEKFPGIFDGVKTDEEARSLFPGAFKEQRTTPPDPSQPSTWERIARLALDPQITSNQEIANLKAAFGSPGSALSAMLRVTEDMAAVFFSNDSKARMLAGRFNAPSFIEYANLLHARAGAGDSTSRDYHTAVKYQDETRRNQLYKAMAPFLGDDAAINRIRDRLVKPNARQSLTQPELDAAKDIAALLKDTLAYRREAGEDIGEILDGYLPRVISQERVVQRRDEFLKRAAKLYREEGQDATQAKLSAEAWFNHIFDTYAGIDGGLEFATTGVTGIGASTARAREFGKRADTLLQEFYEPDLYQLLANYVRGSAMRAEQTRRFGKPGTENSPKRKAWVEKHGDITQLEELQNRMKAEMVASGKPIAGELHALESIHKSNLGKLGSTNPRVHQVVSGLHVWNQVGKLDRVTVTSLGELTMGFIRGGPKLGLPYIRQSMQEAAALIASADRTDAFRWAESYGVVADAAVSSHLATLNSSQQNPTGWSQKLLTGFYKTTGLHQFSTGQRVAAAHMAREMLRTFSGDLSSPSAKVQKRAALYLRELGVADPQAFATRLLQLGEPSTVERKTDTGFAAEYTTAIIRVVEQTQLNPSRAEKPTWAGHPLGSLVFSLAGYSYAFKKNVLDRVARLGVEAFKERDPALLIPAMSLALMAFAQDGIDTYLKPFLYGSNYKFEDETAGVRMLRIADRSGFTGALSPFVNAIKGVRYDRSLLESLAGPIVGQIANFGQKAMELAVRNDEDTNTAERNAAAAFYDVIVKPAANTAIVASRLPGVVKTPAIMASGSVGNGGVIPSPKEAFVDRIAGPKEE